MTVLVAGLAVGDDRTLQLGTIRPILFGLMNAQSALSSWPSGLSRDLLAHIDGLRASGKLRPGPMPDTYNEATRRAEWAATSTSLAKYLPQMGDSAAAAALVTGLAMEVHEMLLVDLEVTRKEAGAVAMRFDPVALAHLEGALRRPFS